MRLVRVTQGIQVTETEREYIFIFGLPPLYENGPERGRIRLPLPKNEVREDTTLLFGRASVLYPRRIRIIRIKGGFELYVETGASFPTPSFNKVSVWKVFILISPDQTVCD